MNRDFRCRRGGIIKAGYNEELDEYRRIARDLKRLLQEMERKNDWNTVAENRL